MARLRLPDAFLFDAFYSFDARAVHAVTLGHPGGNPAVDYVAEALGIGPAEVIAAQRDLELEVDELREQDDGSVALTRTYQAATYKRPTTRFHTGPTPLRFTDSTKLIDTAPEAGLYNQGKKNLYAELPAEVAVKLPKRGRHNSLVRLVAFGYAREQRIRGEIQIEDEAVAYLIGASARQARRVRELLIHKGILTFVRREQPCNVYAMPGAAPRPQDEPEPVNPAWTRRLLDLQLADERIGLYACDREYDQISDEIARLGPEQALAVILARIPFARRGRRHGADVLTVLQGAEDERVDRVGQLDAPCGTTDSLPVTRHHFFPSLTAREVRKTTSSLTRNRQSRATAR
jgi:hypothetical protein